MLAATFAAFLLVQLAAHQVGDHWIQTNHQAVTKGERSRAGTLACLRHVATYTAATAGAGALAWWLLALEISPAGFAAGQAISAITHYWADRRFTLEWMAARLGKSGYYANGGAYQLDQSWHWLWLAVAAMATVRL